MLVLVLVFVAGVNFLTAWSFYDDKCRAIAGERRIPEFHLLRLALLGGTPAAFAARSLFRHKTRKQPFSTYSSSDRRRAGRHRGFFRFLIETACS